MSQKCNILRKKNLINFLEKSKKLLCRCMYVLRTIKIFNNASLKISRIKKQRNMGLKNPDQRKLKQDLFNKEISGIKCPKQTKDYTKTNLRCETNS